jgi:phosphoserine phosphatase
VENGYYNGKSPQHACQGEEKATLTKRLIEQLGLEIDLDSSYAYADSLGDIHLLEMVGNPIAVFPDEHLKPVAEERGWPVIE